MSRKTIKVSSGEEAKEQSIEEKKRIIQNLLASQSPEEKEDLLLNKYFELAEKCTTLENQYKEFIMDKNKTTSVWEKVLFLFLFTIAFIASIIMSFKGSWGALVIFGFSMAIIGTHITGIIRFSFNSKLFKTSFKKKINNNNND